MRKGGCQIDGNTKRQHVVIFNTLSSIIANKISKAIFYKTTIPNKYLLKTYTETLFFNNLIIIDQVLKAGGWGGKRGLLSLN